MHCGMAAGAACRFGPAGSGIARGVTAVVPITFKLE
jgi:hypothetical protein